MLDYFVFVSKLLIIILWYARKCIRKGGRKYVLLSLAPWGCTPPFKALQLGNTGACIDGLATIVKLHNKALFEVLPKLERELKGQIFNSRFLHFSN